jgi:hypothetical protein
MRVLSIVHASVAPAAEAFFLRFSEVFKPVLSPVRGLANRSTSNLWGALT